MIKIVMRRHALSEEQWHRLQKVLPEQKIGPASTLGDRLFVEAVLFRAKIGMLRRDHPERFDPWKLVYNRFNNWAKKGHWEVIFRELQIRGRRGRFDRRSPPPPTTELTPGSEQALSKCP